MGRRLPPCPVPVTPEGPAGTGDKGGGQEETGCRGKGTAEGQGGTWKVTGPSSIPQSDVVTSETGEPTRWTGSGWERWGCGEGQDKCSQGAGIRLIRLLHVHFAGRVICVETQSRPRSREGPAPGRATEPGGRLPQAVNAESGPWDTPPGGPETHNCCRSGPRGREGPLVAKDKKRPICRFGSHPQGPVLLCLLQG